MNYKILEMHTNFGAPQTNVIRIFEKKFTRFIMNYKILQTQTNVIRINFSVTSRRVHLLL